MTIEKLKEDLKSMAPSTPKEIEVSINYLRAEIDKEKQMSNRVTALDLMEAKIGKLERLLKI